MEGTSRAARALIRPVRCLCSSVRFQSTSTSAKDWAYQRETDRLRSKLVADERRSSQGRPEYSSRAPAIRSDARAMGLKRGELRAPRTGDRPRPQRLNLREPDQLRARGLPPQHRGLAPRSPASSRGPRQSGDAADMPLELEEPLIRAPLEPQEGRSRDGHEQHKVHRETRLAAKRKDRERRLGEQEYESRQRQDQRANTFARSPTRPVQHAPRPKKVKVKKSVALPSTIRVENLTRVLGITLFRLQRVMERAGMDDIRPDRLLNADDASLIAMELDFEVVIDDESAFDLYPLPPAEDASKLSLRPPITGIFGHVDHGKTSLLDTLRSTAVAKGEAGGITQHIGAFEVPVKGVEANLRKVRESKGVVNAASSPVAPAQGAGGTITFLDTPGHAAFTAMRERGASVTDVVVLCVAADDGVKPQTQEVIELVKREKVEVVVAVTKVDKTGVDTDKVKKQLFQHGLEVESLGGDTPCVEVSSFTGQGLQELVDTIAALAEMKDLRAERTGRVEARVVESRVEKGRGDVATILVLRGELKPSATLVAGTTWCRVRQLLGAGGKPLKSAFPGQPVEVTGWKSLPSAGDLVLEAATEDEAKKASSNRARRAETEKTWRDLEVINEKKRQDAVLEAVRKAEESKARAKGLTQSAVRAAGETALQNFERESTASDGDKVTVKELNLIVKADVSGTVEAVVGALEHIGTDEAKVKLVSSAVGDVQESDIEMARAIDAQIVAFNVNVSRSVLQVANRAPNPVQVHTSPVIYRLVETIREEVGKLLPRHIETRVHGEANVQQVFGISVKGQKDKMNIAGSRVVNGTFQKARLARVVRKGQILFTGPVSTLKQVKKDVTEIAKGVECGIALDGFADFRPEDVIQSIEQTEVVRSI